MTDAAFATCNRQKGFLRTEECLIGAIVLGLGRYSCRWVHRLAR
jgi:hypothetical protein